MIYSLVQYTVKETAVTEVIGLIEEFVSAVADKEPDVLRYESFQNADKVSFTHVIHFYDEAAKRHHAEAEHTEAFTDKLYPLCEQEPVFTDMTLISTNE